MSFVVGANYVIRKKFVDDCQCPLWATKIGGFARYSRPILRETIGGGLPDLRRISCFRLRFASAAPLPDRTLLPRRSDPVWSPMKEGWIGKWMRFWGRCREPNLFKLTILGGKAGPSVAVAPSG
jgi:hypothetical protein